jgi:hypothetical protein
MVAPPFRTPFLHFHRYTALPRARAVPRLEPARRRAGQQTRRQRRRVDPSSVAVLRRVDPSSVAVLRRVDWVTVGRRCSRETAQAFCLPGVRGALPGLWLPARPVWQACCLGRGPAVVRQGSEVDREMPFVCRGFLLLFASGGLSAAGVARYSTSTVTTARIRVSRRWRRRAIGPSACQ